MKQWIRTCVQCFILCAILNGKCLAEDITIKSGPKSTWISDVISEKLSNFRPQSQANQLCNQQIDSYEKSLQNLTLWALQSECESAFSYPDILRPNFAGETEYILWLQKHQGPVPENWSIFAYVQNREFNFGRPRAVFLNVRIRVISL